MLASLKAEGSSVGVLAAGLQRAATSRKWRSALARGDLALITPFAPEAAFHPGNAMGRNKYIYCLASSAAVVASQQGGGGTWNGAVENLKHRWVPLWVHASAAPGTGNDALADQGARRLPEDTSCLFSDEPAARRQRHRRRLPTADARASKTRSRRRAQRISITMACSCST